MLQYTQKHKTQQGTKMTNLTTAEKWGISIIYTPFIIGSIIILIQTIKFIATTDNPWALPTLFTTLMLSLLYTNQMLNLCAKLNGIDLFTLMVIGTPLLMASFGILLTENCTLAPLTIIDFFTFSFLALSIHFTLWIKNKLPEDQKRLWEDFF